MTTPNNIIGIVKELQERDCSNTLDVAIMDHDILAAFPAIAQALLLAVEALEECSRRDDHLQIVKPIADEALSRIRSCYPDTP
jgi:hypothetical protein